MKSTRLAACASTASCGFGRSRDRNVHVGEAAVAALEHHALTGGVQPGDGRSSRALLVTDREDDVLIGAHAEHRRHAIGGVGAPSSFFTESGVWFALTCVSSIVFPMWPCRLMRPGMT